MSGSHPAGGMQDPLEELDIPVGLGENLGAPGGLEHPAEPAATAT